MQHRLTQIKILVTVRTRRAVGHHEQTRNALALLQRLRKLQERRHKGAVVESVPDTGGRQPGEEYDHRPPIQNDVGQLLVGGVFRLKPKDLGRNSFRRQSLGQVGGDPLTTIARAGGGSGNQDGGGASRRYGVCSEASRAAGVQRYS